MEERYMNLLIMLKEASTRFHQPRRWNSEGDACCSRYAICAPQLFVLPVVRVSRSGSPDWRPLLGVIDERHIAAAIWR